jgi:hypothetical protein
VHHLRLTTPLLILLVVGPAVLDARPAAAEPTLFGIRGGITDDFDTLFFGGHVAFYPSSIQRLRFEPSLELGVGEDTDLLTLRANANFKIMFPVSRDAAFYPIIGPYFYYYSFDEDICGGDCDDTDFGLNLGLGFAFSGFGFDFVFSVPDAPEFTFTVSYTFW